MDIKTDKIKERIADLSEAYNTLLERTKSSLEVMRSKSSSATLHDAIDVAKKKAIDMRELSIDEAEKLAEFVRRDLYDAAHYIKAEERELTDWLKLDLLLIKKIILNNFEYLVDQMKSEIKHTSKNMKRTLIWHTGEITSIGTLECDHCHELIHFHKAGHIPPCPKCQKTNFHRRWKQ